MNNQKNKFWAFIFSFVPGAGHMYIGMMRQGLSLMGIFAGIIALASWLSLAPIVLALPVVWFFAFFDFWNKFGLAPEVFAGIEDNWFFSDSQNQISSKSFVQKHSRALGVTAILLGSYLLLREFFNRVILQLSLSDTARDILDNIIYSLPKITVGVLIIALGVFLIIGKKRALDKKENVMEEKHNEN